jgi:hypothetical protein
MGSKSHNNAEVVVKCPVKGCDYEGLSRGIHLHVRQSAGGGHGPNGDTPENLDLSDLEEVGEKNVTMDYPETREEEDVARLCPYCGRGFQGFRGIKIHVGQKAGQGVHPEDSVDLEKEDCPVARVDDDMNVIDLVEENSIMPSTKRRILDEDSVDRDEIEDLIQEFENEGMENVAERIENTLL